MKTAISLLFICVGLFAQATLSNSDLEKLGKASLSEDFILNMVQTQGSKLTTDVSSLISFKDAGLSEKVIAAAAKKSSSPEQLNTDSIIRLVKAGFSDGFITDLMAARPSTYSVPASRIVELKSEGVSERVLSALVGQSGGRDLPSGSTISVRTIDAIDSEKNNEGDEFKASLEDPIEINGTVVAPKGADVTLRLAKEKESGKLTGKTELTLEISSVTVDGKKVPVETSSVSEYSGSRGVRTAKTAAVVGGIGAVIGAIAGGGKGAAIGAGAGAAAGAGAQVFMKGQRVKVPSETVMSFTTSAAVKLP
jgi:hypothetical protein